MRGIVVSDGLVVEMEPALAARRRRPGVPADQQRLQAPVADVEEVLLQRLGTESVGDPKIPRRAIGALGADVESLVAPREFRPLAEVIEGLGSEIAQHILRRRLLHGEIVVGALPTRSLLRMAGGTGSPTDEGRRAVVAEARPFARGSGRGLGAAQRQQQKSHASTSNEGPSHAVETGFSSKDRHLPSS